MGILRYSFTPKLTDTPGLLAFGLGVKVFVSHPRNPDKRKLAFAAIDTMRGHSSIPQSVVRALHLKPHVVRPGPKPVSGCSQVPVTLVAPSGDPIDPPTTLDVHIHTTPQLVLLGADFLSHFRLEIQPDKDEFLLEPLEDLGIARSAETTLPTSEDLVRQGSQKVMQAYRKHIEKALIEQAALRKARKATHGLLIEKGK